MDFDRYINESKRTSKEDTLAHAAIGLCGEIGEIATELDNTKIEPDMEEIGDAFWYLSMGYRVIGSLPRRDLNNKLFSSSSIYRSTCNFAEIVKKYTYNQ